MTTQDEEPQVGHKIEESAKVYLVLNEDGTGWELDHIVFDGYPLDGMDPPGPSDSECECDRDKPEHEALMEKARKLDMPDIWQLRDIIVRDCKANQ